jgi:hypothetical protein
MMEHVNPAQPDSDSRSRAAAMQMVVQFVVNHYSQEVAGHQRVLQRRAEHPRSPDPSEPDERHAHQGRHDEAQGIAGMVVMDSMDEEMDARADLYGKVEVEEIAVDRVLRQCPGEVSEHDAQDQDWCRQQRGRLPQQQSDRDQIDEWNSPVGARQSVEQPFLKMRGEAESWSARGGEGGALTRVIGSLVVFSHCHYKDR